MVKEEDVVEFFLQCMVTKSNDLILVSHCYNPTNVMEQSI